MLITNRPNMAAYLRNMLRGQALVLALLPGIGSALDASRLWLPKSERKHYPKLLLAAELALAEERCASLLEGTLDREQSTPERPMYRFLCRGRNGMSFNLIVDGNERRALPIMAADILNSALQEAAAAGDARSSEPSAEELLAEAWPVCEAFLLERTAQMQSLRWLRKWPLQPQRAETGESYFLADFDAEDMARKKLKYRATCSLDPLRQVVVEVTRRP